MKIKAMKWLTTAPVAIALAVSLAACGSGSAQPSGTPTDALAGSDQQTLDKYTTATVTPIDQIDKTKLGLNTEVFPDEVLARRPRRVRAFEFEEDALICREGPESEPPLRPRSRSSLQSR